ncbi:hypothetical protein BOX15_Mlig021534g1 [Macrostomum lignano]|uniref:C2H2-type domain-containing protein n=1 Tax=Macrostomum lignano TaxID=282301 RepID=A0A267GYZ5_9PLAT|nr:hypothetical protein BOX15_Mlig021534g1 [Macrostomum lignano]
MWEDDGSSDFGRQANGDSNGSESTGALDLGHSELMYGTFMDPAAAWAGQYDLNQLQHQHQHLQYQHQHQQSLQFSVGHSSEQDEAARAAAGIEGSAMIQAGIIEDQEAAAAAAASGPHQLRLQVQQQQQRQQQLPSVPELASWWGSNANGRQAAATSSGAASTSVWAPDQQHQQLANQPSETVSEREFIIVRKAKASINWDGSPVADASVVYECRICGRQCRWRSSISVHVRTHTGRKPYQCRVCHHRFADSSTRKKHEKKTHGCIIPGTKKAAGFDGQMPTAGAATDASGLQLQHPPEPSNLTCHLCFAMLPNETELTKHLYEYHNHLSPSDFGAPVGAADEIPVLVTPVRRVPVRQPEPSVYQHQLQHQHQVQVASQSVWPEFDEPTQLSQSQLMHRQQQQHQQQQSMGIPLPAVQQSVRDREIDQNIGAAMDQKCDQEQLQQEAQQQQQQQEDGQDLLYPYEIGCLGRDLHGIESILDDGRLGNYHQHLDFDKLDW